MEGETQVQPLTPVKLREIDDRGKVPGAEVPGLEDYCGELSQIVSAQLGGA